MIYYDIVIVGVKIFQIVAWDNYDGFQHFSSVFSLKKSFHWFKYYLIKNRPQVS
jgi:hypothetical protein